MLITFQTYSTSLTELALNTQAHVHPLFIYYLDPLSHLTNSFCIAFD